MSNFGGDTGCDSSSHGDDFRAYDKLPPLLRDRLRRSRDNLCSACIATMARRHGVPATIAWLDQERQFRTAWLRSGDRLLQVPVLEEELRP